MSSAARVVSFRDLLVWQRAMDLVEQIYAETSCFPRAEVYGLTSQLRRASVSIASNVAEGHATRKRGLFLRHLTIAKGSLAEVQTQIELAQRLGFLATGPEALFETTEEIGRMLSGLVATLQNRNP